MSNFVRTEGREGEDSEFVEFRKERSGAYIAQLTKGRTGPYSHDTKDFWYVYEQKVRGDHLRTLAAYRDKGSAVQCALACAKVKWD